MVLISYSLKKWTLGLVDSLSTLGIIKDNGGKLSVLTQEEIWNNDMKMTTFTVTNPYQYLGKYYCVNSDGVESLNHVEIVESSSNLVNSSLFKF